MGTGGDIQHTVGKPKHRPIFCVFWGLVAPIYGDFGDGLGFRVYLGSSLSWVFPVTMIVFIYSMLPSLRCSYRCICFSIVSILSRFLWLCEVCVVLKGCLMVAACGAILAQEPESIRVRQMFFSPIHRGEKKEDRFDYPGLSTLPRTLGGGFGKPARPPPNQGPGSNQWCA